MPIKHIDIGIGGKIALLATTLVFATATIVGYIFYSGSYDELIEEEIELLHNNIEQKDKQLQAILDTIRGDHFFISGLLLPHAIQHTTTKHSDDAIESGEHLHIEELLTQKLAADKHIIRASFYDYAHETTEVFSAYRSEGTIAFGIDYIDTAIQLTNDTTTFSLSEDNLLLADTTIHIANANPIHLRTTHNLVLLLDAITHSSDEAEETSFITDHQGKLIHKTANSLLLATSGNHSIQQHYPETIPLFSSKEQYSITQINSTSETGYVLHVHKTFLNQEQKTGIIALGHVIPYYALTYRTIEIRDKGTMASLVLITIATVIALLFSRMISHPIKQITSATKQFSEGKSALYLPTERKDEIGTLANSFHQMMESIKKQQQSIINNEIRTRTILDNTVDAVITANSLGEIETYNHAAEKIFGFTKEEAIGKNIDILIPDTLSNHNRYLDHVSPENNHSPAINRSRELVAKKKSGGTFPIEISVGAIMIEGERYFVAIIRDITERKRNEEQTTRLAAAIEQATESIAITNPAGVIEYANPAYHRLNRLTSPAAGTTPFILQANNTLLENEVWDALSTQHSWKGQYHNHHTDGDNHLEEASINPIYDKGKLINYVIIGKDISNEKLLEDELRQAQKMQAIGTLAGGIAHDFNNLLSGILGYAELTLEDIPEGTDAHSNIQEMIKASERARDLVKQILAFSRQTPSKESVIQPHLILKEATKLLRASIPKSIDLQTHIEDSQHFTAISPSELHQVIMNICVNASHAIGHATGTIETRLEIQQLDHAFVEKHPPLTIGKYIHITIADSGPGIPEDIIDRIFEPFFTTKEVGKGTGMGLATAHGIITSAKGTLIVESSAETGTKFHIYLPTCKPPMSEQPKVSHTASSTKQPAHILLIDDEEINLGMLKQLLEREGHVVSAFSDSVKALHTFQQTPNSFDLVISDCTMPNLTGDNLAQQIKETTPDLPVILCTGYSENVTPERAEELKIQALLQKPLRKEELLAEIDRSIDVVKQQRQGQ